MSSVNSLSRLNCCPQVFHSIFLLFQEKPQGNVSAKTGFPAEFFLRFFAKLSLGPIY